MKQIKQKHMVVFLFIATLFIGCTDNENPVTDKNEKQLILKIIPSNQVNISWDSTIYQHINSAQTYIDTTAYDSIANFLLNIGVEVENLWCPNENTPCMLPIRQGSEIIVKLAQPDSLIYSYGFQKYDTEFPVDCFAQWRHYKYTSK